MVNKICMTRGWDISPFLNKHGLNALKNFTGYISAQHCCVFQWRLKFFDFSFAVNTSKWAYDVGLEPLSRVCWE